ncbi:MAG TPA: histone deacetylase, partial [Archaeoglobus profundus]|nr:histone deacetylase [Archaeoglobus profundus]
VEGALPYTNLAIIAAMAGLDLKYIREPKNYIEILKWRRRDVKDEVKRNIEKVKSIHSKYWNCFK